MVRFGAERLVAIMVTAALAAECASARADRPALDPGRELLFNQRQKSIGAALLWEIVPGAGSLYADDARGAVVTWGLLAGGAAAMVLGISLLGTGDDAGPRRVDSPAAMPLVLGGLLLAVFGRGYGFVNAARATGRYNLDLRARLGLPAEPPRPVWSR